MAYRDPFEQPDASPVPPPQMPIPGLPPGLPGGPAPHDPVPEDASPLSGELIGDIPPPPMQPHDKAPKVAPPVAMAPPRPDSPSIRAFRTPSYAPPPPPLASPGIPITGGAPLGPDDLGELLKRLAMQQGGQ